VVPLPGNAPEDVVADAEGSIWPGVDDGRIIRIIPDGASPQVMVNTGGRPLGLAVARDGATGSANGWAHARRSSARCYGGRLPYRWLPNPKPTVCVVAFDPDDGHVITQLRTQHPSFGLTTGVVETPGRLWPGCIGGPTICYLDL
jgi:hypothetical protein